MLATITRRAALGAALAAGPPSLAPREIEILLLAADRRDGALKMVLTL